MANPNADVADVGGHDLAHATDDEVSLLNRELGGDEDEGRGGQSDDSDDDGHEDSGDRSARSDSELDEARTDSERDAIRARRKDERARRKQAQRDRHEALLRRQENLEAQNRQMAEQLARLQNNDSAARMAQLDADIAEAAQVVENAKQALANATATADGNMAAQATDLMLRARDRHTQLSGVKSQVIQGANRPSPINPLVRKNAVSFAERNPWYKGPKSNDMDSVVMTQLDNAITKEGFDPASPSYWEELEARAKKYLPHRFDGAADTQLGHNESNEGRRTPRSPVGGAGQRSGATSGSDTGFKLSAGRVAAMKEAGIWDDPDRRKKMIAEYKKRDQEDR